MDIMHSKTRHVRQKKPFGLGWLIMTGPVGATCDKWKRIDRFRKSRFPVRWFITRTVPMGLRRVYWRTLDKWIWWVKSRTTHQQHVIRPRYLKPGWHGTDIRMLNATFEVFSEHVERYYATAENIDRHCADLRAQTDGQDVYGPLEKAWSEAAILYRWWNVERRKRKSLDYPTTDEEFYDHYMDAADRYEAEDNAYLDRLMKVWGDLHH
jgi:hypothetical protein